MFLSGKYLHLKFLTDRDFSENFFTGQQEEFHSSICGCVHLPPHWGKDYTVKTQKKDCVETGMSVNAKYGDVLKLVKFLEFPHWPYSRTSAQY